MRNEQTAQTGNSGDVALLQRIAAGDREAFSLLFSSYYPRIFKFVYRVVGSYTASEELANDVLLAVWKTAERFRGDSKVSTWIFGIAYKQALRRLSRRPVRFLSMDDVDLPADGGDEAVERGDWVGHGISRLPPKQRLTIMLVYYLGLSCEETSEVTQSPVNTVKTRMFHARRKLGEFLSSAQASGPPRKDRNDD